MNKSELINDKDYKLAQEVKELERRAWFKISLYSNFLFKRFFDDTGVYYDGNSIDLGYNITMGKKRKLFGFKGPK